MFLTDSTLSLYKELSENDFFSNFTFVGGSAIAYYLNHRLSEDLDFFTWMDKLPVDTPVFINEIKKNHQIVIANSSDTYIDLLVDDIKITLFANNWEPLKQQRTILNGNIFVANLNLLCAMKINVLSLRAKYRDYFDLYVLNKDKFKLSEMYEHSKKFIPGMTDKIFCMQLSYIDDIDDESIAHLFPRVNVSLIEIQKHFKKEIKTTFRL